MPDHAPLPQTVAELHALVLEQQASMAKMRQEIAERDREIVERDQELERLKAQIDKLRRMHFGRKSEQVDRQIDRLETQLEDLAEGSGVADVRRARARASSSGVSAASPKVAVPPHLPREERVLEPDSTCPKCNNAMELLGEDVSEQLARVTAMFKVIRTIRRKRICTGCGHIVQPPMPGLPIERSIAHPSLLADIVVAKYANHTPLYRQSEIAARDGVRLDRATMARWVGQCEELCRLLTEVLRRYTMATAKLHTDDTPIPVLAPGNKKTKTGRLWVYVRDDRRSGSSEPAAVWFAYSPDRKGIHPQTHLAGFEGVLQADGYAGFNELTESGKVRLASCWDHARRYVFNVHETAPSETTKQWLDMIGDLYEIEAAIRGKPPDERRRVRQEKSKPLLEALEMSMREKLATLWPKAPLVEAINYSLNRWDGLTLFCDDGRVEISNVLAENALRCGGGWPAVRNQTRVSIAARAAWCARGRHPAISSTEASMGHDSTVYVGLDVHKESITAAYAVGIGEVELLGKIGTSKTDIDRLCQRMQSKATHVRIVYEAGPCGYGLYRQLVQKGFDCMVCAPSLIPRKPGERVKTDRRDALKLVRSLRAGDLSSVYVPGVEDEAFRDLARAWATAKADLKHARQRVKSFLLSHGVRYTGSANWGPAHRRWISTFAFPNHWQQLAFDECRRAIEDRLAQCDRLEAALREAVVNWRFYPAVLGLQAMRGIQFTTAVGMLAELGDLSRFEHPRQLMAWLGVTPSEHSSGDRRRQGSITKNGNSYARKLLVEAAWSYRYPARVSPDIQRRHEGIPKPIIDRAWDAQLRLCRRYRKLAARGKNVNTSVVAVARELSGFIWWDISRLAMSLAIPKDARPV